MSAEPATTTHPPLLDGQALRREPYIDTSAGRYARLLLGDLGAELELPASMAPGTDAALDWAASGAMWLTGEDGGAPLLSAAPLTSCARGALQALEALADTRLVAIDGARLLGERAAIAGLGRRGAISPGGSCRLLRCEDGVIALNLARDDDWELLPALLECEPLADWAELEARLDGYRLQPLLERARLLGLAAAPAEGLARDRAGWYRLAARGEPAPRHRRAPLVLDLSSLWAGPLCSHLLQQLGARVVKVESDRRPDGARRGPARFFRLLNADKSCLALPFDSDEGLAKLAALARKADIVIEGSRPRALRHLGIDAEALVNECPGLTWISLSAYGRQSPADNWIGFGDDTGVAAGLSHALWQQHGQWAFCADAIADPLAGLHAALAGWASWLSGGGHLLELSLHGVADHCRRSGSLDCEEHRVVRLDGGWQLAFGNERQTVLPPSARAPRGHARAHGANTRSLLAELAL